jgi:hypothetical protein
MAAPNPFTNQVNFTIQSAVSGQGALELYNTKGQKVSTVFRGYLVAGKAHNVEYRVPNAGQGNLIYVLRVGNQRTSGRLLKLE